MNVLAAMVLGLLIGWLAEWVVDWVYWRNQIRPIVEENANLKDQIKILEAEKNKRSAADKPRSIIKKEGKDNLQAIKGIGPVFSQRLNEAGITTFEQLARLKPKELEKILGELYRRFFSKQETILAQAKEFAQQKVQQA
ncbi:MAG TPA: DUF4332 domain-containing protein [Anaerolineales bacterium]